MKNSLKIKTIFFLFVTIIYFSLAFVALLLIIELFSLGTKLTKKINIYELHNTDYYGKKIEYNPYRKFDNKFLHPFLTFSMPWKREELNKINNEFVSLNYLGYRKNPFLSNEFFKSGIILGGSTAFGYYASSNSTTIASHLTKRTKTNFYNLNGPSWNSSQELISLLKFKKDYDYSVSFSGNNDFSIFCHRTIDSELEENYVDAVERFEDINKVFRSVTDRQLYHLDFNVLIKYFIVNNFSETLKIINYIKFKYNKEKINVPTQARKIENKCLNENNLQSFKKIDKSINQFLYNQNMMRVISNSRGAKHYLILQPQYFKKENTSNKKRELYQYIYKKIMDSNFCSTNCFNFFNIFDEFDNQSFMNNFTGIYENEIFIDNIHLSDIGNEIISEKILKVINF